MKNVFRVHRRVHAHGATFIDVVVGVALLALIFWGIAGAFLLALNLIGVSKAKAGGIALATEQLEFLRSLSYESVGTEGGIPAGLVPQSATTSLNGVLYTTRTFIQFVDAPEDGLGALDENGITTDYKHAKVEVSWNVDESTRSVELISNIVPRGIETVAGGGTLVVNVIDALGAPIGDASVRVVNTEVDPSIDVTTFSNEAGRVLFPGSPEAVSYEISVEKTGYSSAQTYDADLQNVAPSPGHLSILEGQINEITFAIDRVAEKTITTYERLAESAHEDTFTDGLLLEELASTTLALGDIILEESEGAYATDGSAVSITIEPPFLGIWGDFEWSDTTPALTEALYHVLYEETPGVWTRVPENDLLGNESGFDTSPLLLSELNTETYPALRLEARLKTADSLSTPSLHEWSLSYLETAPLPNVEFRMRGEKPVGENASGDLLYKYNEVHSTNAEGLVVLSDLEWDTYDITVDGSAEGYDLFESCDVPQPRAVDPNALIQTKLYLIPHTTHTLHVAVIDDAGTPLADTDVELTRSGFNEVRETSTCGQTLFDSLTASGSLYSLSLTKSGFDPLTIENIDVSGYTRVEAILTAQ